MNDTAKTREHTSAGGAMSHQHRELLSELKHTNAELHDLLWFLEELEQRIQGLAAEGAADRDPALAAEIDRLNAQRSTLEDQALRQLLRKDELAARLEQERR